MRFFRWQNACGFGVGEKNDVVAIGFILLEVYAANFLERFNGSALFILYKEIVNSNMLGIFKFKVLFVPEFKKMPSRWSAQLYAWLSTLLVLSVVLACFLLFFFTETFRSFVCGDIWVICLTVVLKLAVAVFISLYFQTFSPKWRNFFRSFQKNFRLWPKKTACSKPIFHMKLHRK